MTSARPLKPSQLSGILSGVRTTPEAPCSDGRLRGCCVASPALPGPAHCSQFFDTADRQRPGLLSLPPARLVSLPVREQRHPETAERRRTLHPQHHARGPRLSVGPRQGRTPAGSAEPAPSLSGEAGCESAAPAPLLRPPHHTRAAFPGPGSAGTERGGRRSPGIPSESSALSLLARFSAGRCLHCGRWKKNH